MRACTCAYPACSCASTCAPEEGGGGRMDSSTQHHQEHGPSSSLGPVSMGKEQRAVCSASLVVEAAVLSKLGLGDGEQWWPSGGSRLILAATSRCGVCGAGLCATAGLCVAAVVVSCVSSSSMRCFSGSSSSSCASICASSSASSSATLFLRSAIVSDPRAGRCSLQHQT